jgi:sporulation protein YlmC with PRC-barrel domain
MRLLAKKLVGLPVWTRSGTALGKIAGFEIDTETGRLALLHVKTRGLVPALLDQELVVAWDQVIEMTPAQVTVQDAVVPAGARVLAQSGIGIAPGTDAA